MAVFVFLAAATPARLVAAGAYLALADGLLDGTLTVAHEQIRSIFASLTTLLRRLYDSGLYQEDIARGDLSVGIFDDTKHLETLPLILDQRVLLRDRLQADPLTQNIEVGQMTLPEVIKSADHSLPFGDFRQTFPRLFQLALLLRQQAAHIKRRFLWSGLLVPVHPAFPP